MSSLSPEARKLLETSRSAGGPSAAQRAAMKQAVLAAGLLPGTAAAASSAAGGAKAAGLGLAAKLSLVAVSVAAGAGLLWTQLLPSRDSRAATELTEDLVKTPPLIPSEVEGPASRDSRAEDPVTTAPPPLIPKEVPQLIPREVEGRPSRDRAAPALPVTPSAAVAPPSREEVDPKPPAPIDEARLSEEIAAVSRAMGAVDAKTWAAALEQVGAYRATFPGGALETEAGVVEVLALCGLGRIDEARAAAASLPSNNPAVRRLERSCIAARK